MPRHNWPGFERSSVRWSRCRSTRRARATSSTVWRRSCDVTQWQKSSFSGGGDGDECVELALTNVQLLLRESDAPTRILPVAPTALAALLREVKSPRTPRRAPACEA
ncbi:DUF397 domain-containing protein [Streptomyces sp. NPDC046862]|uniref:DUF397 domain-containing protein n=1 Tax=Streptomyces sp. NPDC046862 TaxID=3154603 RepID=UPI003452932E